MASKTAAARICAEQGWAVGDALEGILPGWPEIGRIRITAIGATALLVRKPGAAEFARGARDLVVAGFRKVAS